MIPAPIPPLVDIFADPARFDGVMWRRVFGFGIDFMVIGLLLGLYLIPLFFLSVATLGLLTPLLVFIASLIPAAYHTLTIGGSASATLGMRLLDLEVRTWNGGKPGYLQALLHTALFYLSLGFSFGLLLLLWPLFNNRRRCLHDQLTGTVVLRRL